MIVKPCAEFKADFPDDQIEQNGEIVELGGRNVAEAIADIFRKLGSHIEKIEGDYRGWWCSFTYEGLALEFQLIDLSSHYLFVLHEPLRARPDYALFLHALLDLDKNLRLEGRFHDLLWYGYEN